MLLFQPEQTGTYKGEGMMANITSIYPEPPGGPPTGIAVVNGSKPRKSRSAKDKAHNCDSAFLADRGFLTSAENNKRSAASAHFAHREKSRSA